MRMPGWVLRVRLFALGLLALGLLAPGLPALCPIATAAPTERASVRPRHAPWVGILGLDPLREADRRAAHAEALSGMGHVGALTEPVPWDALEPAPPVQGTRHYEWEALDGAFLTWQLAGLEPVLCLSSRSHWASARPEASAWIQVVSRVAGEGGRAIALREFRGATPPRSDQWGAWGRFVREVVERYDGDGVKDMPGLLRPLRAIQILDRADAPASWLGSNLQYLRLLHAGGTAAKEAHPDVRVVAASVDVGGVGYAPDPDRRAWQERVEAASPRAPQTAVLAARRAQDLLEHLVDLPRTYDVLPQRGAGHIDDDVSNLRFLRRRLAEAGAQDVALWLVGGPTAKTGTPQTPTGRRPSMEERNVRQLWRSAARSTRHLQHGAASVWLQRGEAFDLVRTVLRARAAGADAIYMTPAKQVAGGAVCVLPSGMPCANWPMSFGAIARFAYALRSVPARSRSSRIPALTSGPGPRC